MKHGVRLLACALALCTARLGNAQEAAGRTVVLLLFDGFAPAVVDDTATPALDRMRAQGAWSHHLLPVFPSISLPNQISVSTGCLPAHHGIVSNVFIDPERGRYDHSHDADWLLQCEHLHQVAERQGVRSAALGWVGRSSTRRGKLATYVSEEKSFAEFPQDAERAKEVIDLLRLPEAERPRLILAYFRGPDRAEHFSGMESEQTRAAVRASDAAIGAILDAVADLGLQDRTAVIVTTDHGMFPVYMNINVARILRKNGIDATVMSSGAISFLYFDDPAKVTPAHSKLSAYRAYFQVWARHGQPGEWNIGGSDRVGDLIVQASPPYFIEDIERWPWWTRWLAYWGPEFLWSRPFIKASHGYTPSTAGMAGIFYAWGAGIARGHEIMNLQVLDVHPTVARLLGIRPGSPIDGHVVTEVFDAEVK